MIYQAFMIDGTAKSDSVGGLMKKILLSVAALAVALPASGQDVMKPVVVVGKPDLEAQGNVDLETIEAERVNELLGYVPGLASVAADSAGYGDILAVRGSANTLFFGGPGVAMVVDDVPYGDVFGYSTEFFDLDSFTLHRGPQGSRFARNGVGGLIEMRTLEPGDTIRHGFSAEYGSYNLTHLRFRSSGPINDKWSYAFQSYYKERDGFVDNLTLGRDTDTREQFGALGSLFYRPSSDMQVRFRAMYERTRDGSQRLTALPGVASSFGPIIDGTRAQDPFEVTSDLEGRTEIDRLQLSLHFDHDFNWGRFKSITAFSRWELGPNTVDLDLSPIPASRSAIDQEQDVWSQEFRFESSQVESVRWTTGFAYLRTDTEGVANRFFGTGQTTFANQFTDFDVEQDSFAIFGNAQWDLRDDLTVELGGRLEYVENSLVRDKIDQGNTPFLPPVYPTIRGEADGWFFSPSLGLSHVINPEVSVFARTSLAFKPQGFTGFSDNPATTEFDEEQTRETELGVRYENAGGTVSGELRGYYKRIDDYQLNRSVQNTTDFLVVNADRVDALGLEAELFWRPTDGLTVQATAGWNQIEFEDHTGQNGEDLSGNDVPFLPEFTASLAVRYDFESGLFFQTGVRAVGATFYDESNNRDFRQGSYQVWDAQIGYQADSWTVVAFARNLFDEEYYAFMNNQIAAGVPGDPQIFGVRVGHDF
jgi:iron complex outermembrane receptor protein